MKIKITENQHSKLKLVVEQEEYMVRYESLCKQKINDIEKIYIKVIGLTVDDILNVTLNAEQTIKILDKIETDINNAERSIINLWDTHAIGDDDEGFDMKVNKITETVTDKITSLTLLLNPIEELQRLEKEHKLTTAFPDTQPIKIQSY